MTYQREKTDSTLFLEVNLLKNRLLKLYKCLEGKVTDPDTEANDIARCADVAASLAINVIKLESEGIRAIKQLGLSTAENMATAKKNNNTNLYNNNSHHNNHQLEEENDNRQF
jgi:hypothetical protein